MKHAEAVSMRVSTGRVGLAAGSPPPAAKQGRYFETSPYRGRPIHLSADLIHRSLGWLSAAEGRVARSSGERGTK